MTGRPCVKIAIYCRMALHQKSRYRLQRLQKKFEKFYLEQNLKFRPGYLAVSPRISSMRSS